MSKSLDEIVNEIYNDMAKREIMIMALNMHVEMLNEFINKLKEVVEELKSNIEDLQ